MLAVPIFKNRLIIVCGRAVCCVNYDFFRAVQVSGHIIAGGDISVLHTLLTEHIKDIITCHSVMDTFILLVSIKLIRYLSALNEVMLQDLLFRTLEVTPLRTASTEFCNFFY